MFFLKNNNYLRGVLYLCQLINSYSSVHSFSKIINENPRFVNFDRIWTGIGGGGPQIVYFKRVAAKYQLRSRMLKTHWPTSNFVTGNTNTVPKLQQFPFVFTVSLTLVFRVSTFNSLFANYQRHLYTRHPAPSLITKRSDVLFVLMNS